MAVTVPCALSEQAMVPGIGLVKCQVKLITCSGSGDRGRVRRRSARRAPMSEISIWSQKV